MDVAEPDELRRVLRGQVEQVARRLRRHGLAARTLTLKLRTGDFTTRTRSATLAAPTDVTDELLAAAEKLFAAWARKGLRPLRLIGATASGLGPAGGQQGLFPDPRRERGRRLDRTLDEIVDRFGRDAVRRGETGPREQR